jgi:hypothetical protein
MLLGVVSESGASVLDVVTPAQHPSWRWTKLR